jgi:hypothetical protein
VQQLQQERNAKLDIDARWVLQRLMEEAIADVADLFDEKGAVRPVEQWPMAWRRGLVAGVKVNELWETGPDGRRVQVGVTRELDQEAGIDRPAHQRRCLPRAGRIKCRRPVEGAFQADRWQIDPSCRRKDHRARAEQLATAESKTRTALTDGHGGGEGTVRIIEVGVHLNGFSRFPGRINPTDVELVVSIEGHEATKA